MAGEIVVTLYEDAGGAGDGVSFVGIAPNYPHCADLSQVTTGLHGGCNRGINQSSTWSDCVSSARVSNLPANTRLIFYRGANYTSTQTCFDANGSYLMDLSGTGDTISSFRIIGGNC